MMPTFPKYACSKNGLECLKGKTLIYSVWAFCYLLKYGSRSLSCSLTDCFRKVSSYRKLFIVLIAYLVSMLHFLLNVKHLTDCKKKKKKKVVFYYRKSSIPHSIVVLRPGRI